ncbi:transposase [Algibacillus agarilyticus]|uniref:transposase n=1 Tax=Algibacillus agarilyticus TaxID=2234133 RepID=UPI000DD0B31F|nr:transposase [Algibacillus agarilyticus]
MTKARKSQISLDDTAYYHCVSRCVRRAFLCGQDNTTGQCFEHRREWLVTRIKQLATIFAIDIAAYAIMNNHYHLVLRVDRKKALAWSDDEVLKQWHLLCKPMPVVQRYLDNNIISDGDLIIVKQEAAKFRARLYNISWFMRYLNEFISRQANREDNCTGHFWEGRFKSQALLDQTAILACMAYVDLNPIRANMADTPETSDFTSIQERIGVANHLIEPQVNNARTDNDKAANENSDNDSTNNNKAVYENSDNDKMVNKQTIVSSLDNIKPASLLPFAGNSHISNNPTHIPYELINYLQLVDWTARQLKPNKRGKMNDNTPEILKRLNITVDNWLEYSSHIEDQFGFSLGAEQRMRTYSQHVNVKRIAKLKAAQRYYATPAALT